MKNLICVFALAIVPMMLFGQSAIDLKKDSLELAQLKIKLEKEKLTRELSDLDKKAKDDATKAQIDLYKAQKDLIGGTAPTALSGSITISKGDVTMAETRALVHRSLDKMIGEFIANLKNSTCSPIPCDDQNKKKIIIYNSDIYQSFPDYEALIEQLKILKSQYVNQDTVFTAMNKKAQDVAEIGSIAVAKTVIESLASLATLFRTETEFKVNEEVVSEEVLVSKFRMLDDCCSREYIYPTMFPPKILTSNPLLKEIASLDNAQNGLNDKIKKFTKDKIEERKSKIEKFKSLEKEIKDFQNELNGKKAHEEKDRDKTNELIDKIKDIAKEEVVIDFTKPVTPQFIVNALQKPLEDKIQKQIRIDENLLKTAQNNIEPINENIKKLDTALNQIKTALNTVIDEGKKSTLLRRLLIAESILQEIDNGAYTLKLTASNIGTNRIRKNLFFSTLKHSAFTEINFMLLKDRKLVNSLSQNLYVPFTRKIN